MNIFVFNGVLQYFLCRLIQKNLTLSQSIGVQYLDCGDFSGVFPEVDDLLGVEPLDIRVYERGMFARVPDVEKIFFSNRFNPSEVAIYLEMKGRVQSICAYEDGLALYLGHNFQKADWHDGNFRIVWRNRLRELLLRLGRAKTSLPLYFPMAAFDEFYSIFPDIPGARRGAVKHSLAPAFRDLAQGNGGTQYSGALVLSQSLTTDGLVEPARFVGFLRDLIGDLVAQNGRVYFKPHPRDPASMLDAVIGVPGCELLPVAYQRVPVELFLAKQPGVTAYGFWSSSLAYASGGLGQQAFTFGPEFIAQIPAQPALQRLWGAMEPILRQHGVMDYQPASRYVLAS